MDIPERPGPRGGAPAAGGHSRVVGPEALPAGGKVLRAGERQPSGTDPLASEVAGLRDNETMSEIGDRAAAIVQRAASNTVSPAVAALMTAAGVVTGHLELAAWAVPVSALAGSATEESVALVRRLWVTEGVEDFADAVEAETGKPIEDLLAEEGVTRKARQLLGEAVASAATTADEWKVRTLARAFVVGATDGTKVDEMRILVRLLEDFEGADARFLAAAFNGGEGGSSFTASDLNKRDEGLGLSTPFILQKLRGIQLIELVKSGANRSDRQETFGLTHSGRCCALMLMHIDGHTQAAS
nr:hypothetical protein GCM10020092_050640 [Actinoplanes digitatis]